MGLTDVAIRNKRAPERRTEISDRQNNLYIQLLPSGVKTWVIRYRFDDRARRMSIGTYPALSLEEARVEAKKHNEILKRGEDPAAVKAKQELERKSAPTFAEVVAEFDQHHLQGKKRGRETLRLLHKDAATVWSERKVGTITRREIVLMLDGVQERGRIVRNRVLGALSRLFSFAIERGITDHNPCTGIKKLEEKPRSHTLNDEGIRLLWEALDQENMIVDCYRLTKLALKLVLITGQRPGEVAGLAWEEIDGAVWTIPASRSKIDEEHKVPLTALALEIIEQARLFTSGSCFVFRSTHRSGDQPMTRHALARAIKNHRAEIGIGERFTPHDLRRTVRTKLAEIGVADVVAERVMGHRLQGMLRVYNQYHYAEEKRQALRTWEKHLRRIVGMEEEDSGKVIYMRQTAIRQVS